MDGRSMAGQAGTAPGPQGEGNEEFMVYDLLNTLYVIVCFILLIVVLLQQGKGGDMASAFGGGSSQTAFGARGGVTVLMKVTTICAVLFMVGALALAIIGQRGPGSILSGASAPAPVSAPASSSARPSRRRRLRRRSKPSIVPVPAGDFSKALLAEVAELADAPA